jgi:hypothetical protein
MKDGPDTFISVSFISSDLSGWVPIGFSEVKGRNPFLEPCTTYGPFCNLYIRDEKRKYDEYKVQKQQKGLLWHLSETLWKFVTKCKIFIASLF